MKKTIFIFTILLVYIKTVQPIYATQTLHQKINRFIQKFEIEKKNLHGGAIAIIQNGNVIYKTTFGRTRGKKSPLITSETLFPLASISKLVSATAIMLQVEKGTIFLDEQFRFSYLKYPVTLKHILSHTTGYYFPGNSDIEKGIHRNQLLQILKKQKPTKKPGHGYRYSNTLFSLLEEILKSKNLTFQDAIEELANTINTNGIKTIPLSSHHIIAHPHIQMDHYGTFKTLPIPLFYPKTVPAAAGVFASLDGMIEFFKFCFGYQPQLITESTRTQLFQPIARNRDIDRWSGIPWPCSRHTIQSFYGLGCRILKANVCPEKTLIFHSGYLSGLSTFIGFIPSENIGIIILANQNSGISLKKGIEFWGTIIKSNKSSFLKECRPLKRHNRRLSRHKKYC